MKCNQGRIYISNTNDQVENGEWMSQETGNIEELLRHHALSG